MKNSYKVIIKILFGVIVLLLSYVIFIISYRMVSVSEWYTAKNAVKAESYIAKILNKNKFDGNYKDIKFSWNVEFSISNFRYYNAFVMYALAKTNKTNYVASFYNSMIDDEGYVYEQKNKDYIVIPGELDTVFTYYPLYYLPTQQKYNLAIAKAYDILANQDKIEKCGNNYYHKKNSVSWEKFPFSIDGIFMALPFAARHDKNYSEIFDKIKWVNNNMCLKNGLFTHGSDVYGKSNNIVWLRGVGWYALAQMELIEIIDDENIKNNMISDLSRFFDGILKYQSYITGMWRNVVYPKEHLKCNNYESSGTLMLAYALIDSYMKGYTKDKKYLKAGLRAYNGVIDYNFTKGNNPVLKNIYLYSGVKRKSKDYCICDKYVSDEAKGIASLILANGAIQKFLESK